MPLRIQELRAQIAELSNTIRQLQRSGLAPEPAKWQDDKTGDATEGSACRPVTPETLQCQCSHHAQATIVAIDPRAETALGNRAYSLNKPHWARRRRPA